MNPTAMPWYRSKIIVGAIISIVAKILVATGVISELAPADADQIANLVVLVLGGVGDLVAIGARVKQKAAPVITANTTDFHQRIAPSWIGALLAIGLMFTLSACEPARTATHVASVATASDPLGDRIVMDEKAMYAAEAIYNVPAQAYVSADSRGLIPATLKATLKPKLIYLGQLLDAVRSAYKLGDATSFGQRYHDLKALKEQITPLIPGAAERTNQ